ncbi:MULTISPECIES: hypothetical protein [unclassified Variovorax]|uniref:hypothetical protein n=1 Tax=unclassified Variovorax TaxID=663243 RepID=UPI002B239546|nr:hypothetical protein [Variovorax sp. LG9.2]MEB0060313.1 hypothetical protein [Variovorax sp. LG9.2]
MNYQQRCAQGLPISSADAESAVHYVVGQRMKRNGLEESCEKWLLLRFYGMRP